MARRNSKATDFVESNVLYTEDEFTGIRLSEPAWSMWLEDSTGFYYRHDQGSFTARKQHHRRGYFWYAYKRINGKLHKKYLGMRENVTAQRLADLASEFAGLRKGSQ